MEVFSVAFCYKCFNGFECRRVHKHTPIKATNKDILFDHIYNKVCEALKNNGTFSDQYGNVGRYLELMISSPEDAIINDGPDGLYSHNTYIAMIKECLRCVFEPFDLYVLSNTKFDDYNDPITLNNQLFYLNHEQLKWTIENFIQFDHIHIIE